MRNDEKPMADRMIQILNRLMGKLHSKGDIENYNYCKRVRDKLEMEKEE